MKLTLKESEMTGRHYRTVRETIKQEAKRFLLEDEVAELGVFEGLGHSILVFCIQLWKACTNVQRQQILLFWLTAISLDKPDPINEPIISEELAEVFEVDERERARCELAKVKAIQANTEDTQVTVGYNTEAV